jgi:hypothetical protein
LEIREGKSSYARVVKKILVLDYKPIDCLCSKLAPPQSFLFYGPYSIFLEPYKILKKGEN